VRCGDCFVSLVERWSARCRLFNESSEAEARGSAEAQRKAKEEVEEARKDDEAQLAKEQGGQPAHNRRKKILAAVLIGVASLPLLLSFLLSIVYVGVANEVRKSSLLASDTRGEILGGIVFYLALSLGLIPTIKWQLKLAGYSKTAGRQAVSIFLIALYGTGFLASIGLLRYDLASGIPAASIGLVGLCMSVRRVKKLRRSEQPLTTKPLAAYEEARQRAAKSGF
jgi:hypothetical protein